jgi:hypothetical protein
MWFPLESVADLSGSYPFRGAVPGDPEGDVAVVQLHEAGVGGQTLGDSILRVANYDGRYDRYLLEPQNLLIQARGFRHPAGIVRLQIPAIAAPGLHTLRPRADRVTSSYLAWCLNHPRIQAAIAEAAQGTHAPFIAKQALANLLIPVPPFPVQRQIAEVSKLREHERQLATELAEARDSLVNGATWEAAVSDAGREGSA